MKMMSHTREAVRVKVKKCEQNRLPEWRKFSVDPQITSLEVLYTLLAKAFDIKCDFSIKYKAYDPAGNEMYLSVLSDWDLDAAFLRIHNFSIQTSTEPCLLLQIDIKPFTEVKEWDCGDSSSTSTSFINSTNVAVAVPSSSSATARELISPLQQSFGASQKYMHHMQTKLPGLIMNQMEKTFSIVQKAFNLSEETMASLPPRAPLSDGEFRLFLDALGQVQRTDELRKVIFFGGIDPSLRRFVWKHILNVYPNGMNGQQRMSFMKRKSEQYYALRDTWKVAIKKGYVIGELSYVTSMVKKDVLRTDRLHPFYAGSDDNQNIASLYNILTTYALNHPAVNYCQGMSDIASPLLVTMNDEAQAYICFCAIMSRVKGNFMIDGIAMTQKFAHLTEALSFYDPEFWDYLKSQQADDLLFCYRWLLLEMKREFPFEDALRMLEVQWSSLKYETNGDKELNLFEKEFIPSSSITSAPSTSSTLTGSIVASPLSPSYLITKSRENPYTKVCALRRQSSLASLSTISTSSSTTARGSPLNCSKRLNQSLDENISRQAIRRQRRSSSKAHQSLDESKMLKLIGGIDEMRNNKYDEATSEDMDDDVFTNDTSSPVRTNINKSVVEENNDDEEKYDFHPTNPFKDDAAVKHHESNGKIHPTRVNQIPHAFRLSSEDENSIELNTTQQSNGTGSMDVLTTIKNAQIPKSIAKLHNKNILSNYNTVSNIIAKQLANANTVANVTATVQNSTGGHFKELKDKIAATSRKGFSFDEGQSGNEKTQQQKLVKNFNEFLNFASNNKKKLTDKLTTSPMPRTLTSTTTTATMKTVETTISPKVTTTSTQSIATTINTNEQEYHNIKPNAYPILHISSKTIFGSSVDDSDDESSSVPETSWSGSTAATAIQQTNNWSMNSLHLELNSLTSTATHTPERTPIMEKKIMNDNHQKNNERAHLTDDPSLTPDDGHDNDQDYYPMTTAITRELRLEAENLDRQVFGEMSIVDSKKSRVTPTGDIEYEKLGRESLEMVDDLKPNEIRVLPDITSELSNRRRSRQSSIQESLAKVSNWNSNQGNDKHSQYDIDEHLINQRNFNNNRTYITNIIAHPPTTMRTISLDSTGGGQYVTSLCMQKTNPFIDETLLMDGNTLRLPNSNSLPEVLVPISTDTIDTSPVELATNASDEIAFSTKSPLHKYDNCDSDIAITAPVLPSPSEFGGGNPFLMFLCLTLLLQHRNTIMKTGMDYNEIAMHFDKMVRKHDVTRVLNQARRMYIDYLKIQNAYKQQMQVQLLNSDINKNSTAIGVQQQQKTNNVIFNTTAVTGATPSSTPSSSMTNS